MPGNIPYIINLPYNARKEGCARFWYVSHEYPRDPAVPGLVASTSTRDASSSSNHQVSSCLHSISSSPSSYKDSYNSGMCNTCEQTPSSIPFVSDSLSARPVQLSFDALGSAVLKFSSRTMDFTRRSTGSVSASASYISRNYLGLGEHTHPPIDSPPTPASTPAGTSNFQFNTDSLTPQGYHNPLRTSLSSPRRSEEATGDQEAEGPAKLTIGKRFGTLMRKVLVRS
jgi:hypothetical protein